MTHPFYCHYTGKDGHTPRRRLQQLTFFDQVPSIGNSTSSPTPLWVEEIRGQQSVMLMLHAQLSQDVAVYIEFFISAGMCRLLGQHDLSPTLSNAATSLVEALRQRLDFTAWLKAHPDHITPPVLNAYKEARSEEYEQIKALSIY